MSRAKQKSLLAVAQGRAGMVKGARVVSFMIAWNMARSSMGDEWPADDGLDAQVRAYAGWWKEHPRTTYRDIERFRLVFPDEASPTRIMDAVQGQWDERRGVSGLGGALIPA